MTTRLYESTRSNVYDKLAAISRPNGFKTDPCVLEGWLTLYAADLISGKNGKTFPAICVQYANDKNGQQKGSVDNKAERQLSVIGAVHVDDCGGSINEALDDLLFDIKCALCELDRKIDISDVAYMLPETNEPYAMFEVKVTVTQTEKWQKG